MSVCGCFWGDFKLRCWLVHFSIDMLSEYFFSEMCVYMCFCDKCDDFSRFYSQPLMSGSLYLHFVGIWCIRHTQTHTYTIIRIPCVILFYVHSLNMGMVYIETVRWKVVVASATAADAFVVVSIDGLNLVKRQSNDSVAISATACHISCVCGASDSECVPCCFLWSYIYIVSLQRECSIVRAYGMSAQAIGGHFSLVRSRDYEVFCFIFLISDSFDTSIFTNNPPQSNEIEIKIVYIWKCWNVFIQSVSQSVSHLVGVSGIFFPLVFTLNVFL